MFFNGRALYILRDSKYVQNTRIIFNCLHYTQVHVNIPFHDYVEEDASSMQYNIAGCNKYIVWLCLLFYFTNCIGATKLLSIL